MHRFSTAALFAAFSLVPNALARPQVRGSFESAVIEPVHERLLSEKEAEKQACLAHKGHLTDTNDRNLVVSGAIITNGLIKLGVTEQAALNVPGGEPTAPEDGRDETRVGLRYIFPDGRGEGESTSYGCTCEGWGVGADGESIFFNTADDNSLPEEYSNIFTATDSTAVSTLTFTSGTMRVTHDYHPAAKSKNLYEVTVTLENLSGETISDVPYRRVFDWDIYPTPFDECSTVQPHPSTVSSLVRSSNDGFMSANPYDPFPSIPYEGIDGYNNFTDLGPQDHGASFEFQFGPMAASASITFNTYYGAAANEAEAKAALGNVGAEVYSIAKPMDPETGGCRDGPNVYIFGFAAVGGEKLFTASPTISTAPSSAPTISQAPTMQPTPLHSSAPSSAPSSSPSDVPSSIPSFSPSNLPTVTASKTPSTAPTITHSSVPSVSPSQNPTVKASDSPSESPSLSPSTSGPTTSPTLSPSYSPTASPTSVPSMQPSNTHSSVPSVSPSQNPTVTASDSPSESPSLSPSTSGPTTSPTLSPSYSPTASPTSVPSMQPSIVEEIVEIPGSVSTNVDICELSGAELTAFVDATIATIRSFACPDADNTEDCTAKITNVCGSGSDRRSLSSRRLQENWQIEYVVSSVFTCKVAGCTSPEDKGAVAAIAESVSTTMKASMSSGSFLSVLSTNIVASSGLDHSIVNCLIVWGTVGEPVTAVGTPGTGVFYPDWVGHSGTCLEDGQQPDYMINSTAWLFSSIEECCARYYPGWNFNKCMNPQGSGLWYADTVSGKCVTDCEEGNGETCGGLANPISDDLYSDPRSCCEAQLHWRFVEFCEADSFQSKCYAGTGLYYRGDVAGSEVCVRDCNPTSGDTRCGGLVEESYVVLHDTAEACCTSEYNWIDRELCTIRTDKLVEPKYYADKTSSKCVDDSQVPSGNLDVQLFDTVTDCCAFGIFWLSKEACFIASGVNVTGLTASGTTAAAATGSNKFYIDWVNQVCIQDCEGPAPCGGLAKSYDFLFVSGEVCCAQMPWVPKRDCMPN